MTYFITSLSLIISITTLPVHASSQTISTELFEKTTSSPSEIKPSDLAQLVGLPFRSPANQSFKIHQSNSKGETVGIAYFDNQDYSIELFAWYWNPEKGFQIIARQSELLGAYGKDIHKVPFQFSKLVINESGIAAGSFLVNEIPQHFHRYPWFWWSCEKGLHLSEIPSQTQVLERINDQGFVLIGHNTSSEFTLILKNIYQPEYSQIFAFNPYFEIPPSFQESLKSLFCEVNYYSKNAKLTLHLDWYPFSIEQFNNDLSMTGHGTCEALFFQGISGKAWHIEIAYKIDNKKAVFYVKKITDRTNSQSRANCSFNENEFVIYEKEF